MKKTRNKIFITIFSILTFVVVYVYLFSFYENYKMQKNMIEKVLRQMGNFERKLDKNINPPPGDKIIDNQRDEKRIYLGFMVYTIMLDTNGKFKEIINHTENDNNSEYIENIAREIIDNHTENLSFGNLLYTKYVYSFTDTNSLILIDVSSINESLRLILFRTIIMIFLSEIILILITYYLTKWIMKPVIESFERQKAFVADASHELKTPLSVMIASCEMFYQDQDIKWIDNIKSESERMSNLVRNLLDLSKTEKENVVLSNLNISKIIENSVLTLESLFYDKNIKLNYKIDDDIYFKCNEDQIKELMGILLDNAIKHCEKKGNVNIFLTKNNKNNIILKVENTGEPILPEEEEKIFERFYRSDASRNRDSNRYGLGLAIAKNIVERNNGTIKAHSEGGITVFKVTWNQK